MSKTLNEHFKNQSWDNLQCGMDDIRKNIYPDYLADFDDYRRRLLGIIEDPSNACVISDESVQKAIATGNNKIVKAFSGHARSLQVEKAVTEAANNTSWKQVA